MKHGGIQPFSARGAENNQVSCRMITLSRGARVTLGLFVIVSATGLLWFLRCPAVVVLPVPRPADPVAERPNKATEAELRHDWRALESSPKPALHGPLLRYRLRLLMPSGATVPRAAVAVHSYELCPATPGDVEVRDWSEPPRRWCDAWERNQLLGSVKLTDSNGEIVLEEVHGSMTSVACRLGVLYAERELKPENTGGVIGLQLATDVSRRISVNDAAGRPAVGLMIHASCAKARRDGSYWSHRAWTDENGRATIEHLQEVPRDLKGGRRIELVLGCLGPDVQHPVLDVDESWPDNMLFRLPETGALVVRLRDKNNRVADWPDTFFLIDSESEQDPDVDYRDFCIRRKRGVYEFPYVQIGTHINICQSSVATTPVSFMGPQGPTDVRRQEVVLDLVTTDLLAMIRDDSGFPLSKRVCQLVFRSRFREFGQSDLLIGKAGLCTTSDERGWARWTVQASALRLAERHISILILDRGRPGWVSSCGPDTEREVGGRWYLTSTNAKRWKPYCVGTVAGRNTNTVSTSFALCVHEVRGQGRGRSLLASDGVYLIWVSQDSFELYIDESGSRLTSEKPAVGGVWLQLWRDAKPIGAGIIAKQGDEIELLNER